MKYQTSQENKKIEIVNLQSLVARVKKSMEAAGN